MTSSGDDSVKQLNSWWAGCDMCGLLTELHYSTGRIPTRCTGCTQFITTIGSLPREIMQSVLDPHQSSASVQTRSQTLTTPRLILKPVPTWVLDA